MKQLRNNYFKFDKYGARNTYKDYYIDHEEKTLPHIEFIDECRTILKLTITRYMYVPGDVLETTLFDHGYTELFEKEENNV